jgi:hypothetical protein
MTGRWWPMRLRRRQPEPATAQVAAPPVVEVVAPAPARRRRTAAEIANDLILREQLEQQERERVLAQLREQARQEWERARPTHMALHAIPPDGFDRARYSF